MNQNNLVNLRAIKNKKSISLSKIKGSNKNGKYYGESDDSDDERVLSRIGRLQTKKYQDKDFIGYDQNLNKIMKKQAFTDQIEQFLHKSENKDWWRVVRDELNNQDVVLSDKQLHLLDRIRTNKSAQSLASNDYFFMHPDFDQFDLISSYMPKRRFIGSKWERIKINKLVQGIKLGRIILHPPQEEIEKLHDIWIDNNDEQNAILDKYLPPRIPAAKATLPTNIYSYNPPQEYLFTPEEKQQWMQTDPEDRDVPFIPQKFKNLRSVPSTDQLTRDTFNRCLDLYLSSRVRRKKLMMTSGDFLPEIPKPEELKPFPTHLNTEFMQVDHEKAGSVKQICIRNDGQLLFVCYERVVCFFDTRTTKCLYSYWSEETLFGIDVSVQGLVAVMQENGIVLLSSHFDQRKFEFIEEGRTHLGPNQQTFIWNYIDKGQELVKISLPYNPLHISFHNKGDYLVSTQPGASTKSHSILVHCLSKAQTSQPFHNMKATTEVQQTIFHPTQASLLIMTNKNIFIYSLNKQCLVKKLLSGNQQNSSIAIHPYGENVLIGSNDHKVCWFDLEMGKTPFKKMSYHSNAVNRVCFHQKYPLFASCSDDGSMNIFHCRVSQHDYSAPIILPLKVLKAKKKLQLIDIVFHPSQPWIYSVSADGNVCMWT